MNFKPVELSQLRDTFAARLQEGVLLSRFTAARIGGEAEFFMEVTSLDELVEVVTWCWEHEYPYLILGGGSNILVSDAGVRGMVILNRARQTRFDKRSQPPTVWAESGANLGVIARQASQQGLAGLEWAAGIPGTVGGAVLGNAGAHGKDIAGNLQLAEILHRSSTGKPIQVQREKWTVDMFNYSYRESFLKHHPGSAVVLSASLNLEHSVPQVTQSRIDEFSAYRRRTQPPGASMGSMFKNPPGDYAGRLIESAGLKGTRIGNAMISNLHANFFINLGDATAGDVFRLIQIAKETVVEKFGVDLELEIELIGEW